jgi:hypothetical protein
MLVVQAASWQALFVNLSLRAAATNDIRRQGELLALALKAQSNCRGTISALTDQISHIRQLHEADQHTDRNR